MYAMEKDIVVAPNTRSSLGLWLWFYILSRLLLAPFMFLRYLRHPLDHLYLSLLGSLTLVGGAAALLILMRKSRSLTFVSLDLGIRLATDFEFFLRSFRHPLLTAHSLSVHAVTMFLITFVLGILPTCLWFLYFNQSFRVRKLFGENLYSRLIQPSPYKS